MTEKELRELNRKLAKWAGCASLGWLNFTQSLDLCFEWLVPAWNKHDRPITTWIENIWFCLMSGDLVRATIQQFDIDEDVWADGNTYALALCLAIERLIDEEV